jgi:hypothetical protein
LDVLDEGVGFFPWNTSFIYQAAWLNAQHGFTSAAQALIARGLSVNSDTAMNLRFEKLRATLNASPSSAGPRR